MTPLCLIYTPIWQLAEVEKILQKFKLSYAQKSPGTEGFPPHQYLRQIASRHELACLSFADSEELIVELFSYMHRQPSHFRLDSLGARLDEHKLSFALVFTKTNGHRNWETGRLMNGLILKLDGLFLTSHGHSKVYPEYGIVLQNHRYVGQRKPQYFKSPDFFRFIQNRVPQTLTMIAAVNDGKTRPNHKVLDKLVLRIARNIQDLVIVRLPYARILISTQDWSCKEVHESILGEHWFDKVRFEFLSVSMPLETALDDNIAQIFKRELEPDFDPKYPEGPLLIAARNGLPVDPSVPNWAQPRIPKPRN